MWARGLTSWEVPQVDDLIAGDGMLPRSINGWQDCSAASGNEDVLGLCAWSLRLTLPALSPRALRDLLQVSSNILRGCDCSP